MPMLRRELSTNRCSRPGDALESAAWGDVHVWYRNWMVSRKQELASRQEALARSRAAEQLAGQRAQDTRRARRALVSCHSGSQHKSSVSYARPGCVERTVRCSPGSHRRFSSRRTACRRHCWCRGTPRWRPPTAARSDASHGSGVVNTNGTFGRPIIGTLLCPRYDWCHKFIYKTSETGH